MPGQARARGGGGPDEPDGAGTTLRPMILASASGPDVVLSVTAAGAYLVPAATGDRLSERTRRMAAAVAWLLHGSVLAWMLFGDQPRFGFAPALSVTAWLVLTVYAVESEICEPLVPNRSARLSETELNWKRRWWWPYLPLAAVRTMSV